MKNECLYVMAGSESRYVLTSLAEYMRGRGENVLEVDTESRESISRMMEISKNAERIIYITSDHVGLDCENLRTAVSSYQYSLSNLEIIEYLKPIKTVLYTHDLGQVIGVGEDRYLDLFDLVLFPYINNEYYFAKRRNNQVEEIGWIKKERGFSCCQGYTGHDRVVYFPSNMAMSIERFGIGGFAKWIEGMIDKSVLIKPSSFEKMRPVLNVLEEKGYTILDPQISVYDIMENASLVVTNGSSSIVYEAALSGFPVISVLDGFKPDHYYRKEKPHMKWAYSMHPEEVMPFIARVRAGEMILGRGEDILKPFDYERAYQLLR